jgi:hypothetical protein
MVRKFIGILTLAVLSVLSLSAVAKADTMDTFNYQSNGNTFVWQLPASPVPDSDGVFSGMAFALSGVSVSENGGPAQLGEFLFFSSDCAGGFDLSFGPNLVANTAWTMLYQGPESNPTFLSGKYELIDFAADIEGTKGTLVISDGNSAVPEPSALVLLIVGLLALSVGFGSKRLTSVPAVAAD